MAYRAARASAGHSRSTTPRASGRTCPPQACCTLGSLAWPPLPPGAHRQKATVAARPRRGLRAPQGRAIGSAGPRQVAAWRGSAGSPRGRGNRRRPSRRRPHSRAAAPAATAAPPLRRHVPSAAAHPPRIRGSAAGEGRSLRAASAAGPSRFEVPPPARADPAATCRIRGWGGAGRGDVQAGAARRLCAGGVGT
ncbi:hypothetical protein PVAP13_2NG278703 [Panicum virgatum]|uniref:Uncharacterized protein n=1 Tax=Panicum virgatum TaxID=38727 RepID=A0A8T0VLB7_PANVG|nr:hypothetical protein PVAP13_2NG278703 [Panicum virgatum]